MAQESLLCDRFQRAAEVLDHDSIAVRMGGVQTLAELAARNMDQYCVTVANLLEVFIISATSFEGLSEGAEMGWDGDIQVARDAVEMLRGLRS